MVQVDHLNYVKVNSIKICKDGIEFDDNTKIKADVVVFATGYDGSKKKVKSILPEPLAACWNTLLVSHTYKGHNSSFDPKHGIRGLSRECFEPSLFGTVQQMLEQTNLTFLTLGEPGCFLRDFHFFTCLLKHLLHTWELKFVTFSINHSDEICEEMGWTSWRKNTWLPEVFSPNGSQDYLKKQ
ncbi:unnamed protein product [Prunus armeniaca]|uniref:Flavin-containing monooxygenase n=1 Tax=Prunus armeniaca TaxID=36596 RepID=A0A6J5VGH1_PRUAR|nr:unnamed protein product [Prunus armeniaca]